MANFEEREKGFERKFAHDEELKFRATARRNRLLGLWAAEQMGLTGDDAQAYAREVVKADLAEPGEEDVFRKIRADFDATGVGQSDHQNSPQDGGDDGRGRRADRIRRQGVSVSMREDRLRKAAKERRTLFNAWLTLNNPFLIELIGEAGWDCITIDQQHGLGGNEALLGCLTAARACGLPAIVRVAENSPGLIGRALDAGAQGIMCPLIGSVEDAEAFVQAVKFPPRGNRSWGPYRARLDHQGDYFKIANDWTIACPQIETRGALDQLDEILALDGVDMVCFGPNDLSVALTGRLDIWAPEVKEAMTLVLSKCREMSVIALIFANDVDYARPRVAEGWDVVAVGTDAGWFSKGAAEAKAAACAKA